MKTVHCPTCKKLVQWSNEFPYRPFCSDRCRLIDLGAWADDAYVIPSQTPLDNDENIEEPTEPEGSDPED